MWRITNGPRPEAEHIANLPEDVRDLPDNGGYGDEDYDEEEGME